MKKYFLFLFAFLLSLLIYRFLFNSKNVSEYEETSTRKESITYNNDRISHIPPKIVDGVIKEFIFESNDKQERKISEPVDSIKFKRKFLTNYQITEKKYQINLN